MGKKTITGTKNVYELAQERLKVIFNEFDNIYVSFSGGKDSGVLLNMCIDYIRRNNLKIRLGVFHMDYEIQYKMTIDYVDNGYMPHLEALHAWRRTRTSWMYTVCACLSGYLRVHLCISPSGGPGRITRKISGYAPCLRRP